MYVIKLKETNIDLEFFDNIVNNCIPAGFNIHPNAIKTFDYSRLKCFKHLDISRLDKSIGSLGGGNHFIELDTDNDNNLYLVIHSGSRNLGVQVCKYYQDLAYSSLNEMKIIKENLINKLTKEGRSKEIQAELKKIKKPSANKDLAHLTGNNFSDYMHDMFITYEYAKLNRETIAEIIIKNAKLNFIPKENCFHTIHNYIGKDSENKLILRKGAISAKEGEQVIIPINMRDGSLLCTGKGNEDWNYSAPHGAGRLMSRSKAKENITIEEFKESMNNVYSTSVCTSTIDESPQAYKPINEIIKLISDTVKVDKIIKPIYNFKAH